MLYKEWLNDWLENYVSPSAKPRTYARYSDVVQKRLIPKFGDTEIAELTPYAMQKYITELTQRGNVMTGKGLSTNSVNSIIAVIQGSLRIAYSLGLIETYTMDKIKRPKGQEKAVSCFSKQEQKIIEQAVLRDKRDKMFGIIVCLYTGLRIGELLALEWTDIDFAKAELTVNKTCFEGKNKNGEYCRFVNAPKTNTSRRIVPIPKQLLPNLREMKKKSESQYVISNKGKYIHIRSYQRSFELLLKNNNLTRRGFHALRHTFATRALECGMDVKTLSEILGHKNPTITLNRYAHSMMEHKKEMMDRVGKLL